MLYGAVFVIGYMYIASLQTVSLLYHGSVCILPICLYSIDALIQNPCTYKHHKPYVTVITRAGATLESLP